MGGAAARPLMDHAALRARLVAALPVAIGLAVFLAALEVLRLELHAVSWHELTGDVLATPLPYLALALAITALNYFVLAGYDVLAFEYIGKAVPLGPLVGVSMLAYAVAHNVGFAMLSGASVRYRFYTRWGVTAEEL
ncbi:MAG TPA: YbhN family protein, partial [Vicinamibacterales bacterium]|nr:YbhN family protein [Vicinamibacterales bacterium]